MFNSDAPVRVEHFYPVPVCFGVMRKLMQHPLGGWGGLKRGIGCTSRGECCSPSNPGTPQNCLRRFCGEPHSGFPPPLRHSTCSPSFAAHLSHGCSFSPSEYTFGGDPLESAVLLKCGIDFSSLLIEFESRIEIIKRRTVLTERRSLCPTENTFGGDPDGERRATRRARCPCLLNASSSLRGRRARRGVQAAAAPPVNAWVSGA